MNAVEALLEAWTAPLEPPRVEVPAPVCPPFADEVLDPPSRYKVLYGGRGAGRSWSVARKLLAEGARRRLRVLCARELQRSIKDSVHRLLQDQIEALALGRYYEVLRDEIRGTNGTLFLFEGLRYNTTKIKSLEGLDIVWTEEAERISEDSWKVLVPTVRKGGSEIWITFNPDQETDPTYRRFVANPPPRSIVRKVGWEDNPYFPEELQYEKDYDYSVDPDAAAHVWGGECRTATDAQVLKGKWVVEEFEPELAWSGPYFGGDFGFANDPFVLIKCWIGPGVRGSILYVEHEAYRVGLELDHTPEFCVRHVPDCESYVIRADSSRPESISYLARHGLPRIESAPKWQGSVEDGVAFLRQFERIVVHPRCRHTADECRHYSYKVDKLTSDVLPIIVDAFNHCIDAIRYALAPMIRSAPPPPTAYSPAAEKGQVQRRVVGRGRK